MKYYKALIKPTVGPGPDVHSGLILNCPKNSNIFYELKKHYMNIQISVNMYVPFESFYNILEKIFFLQFLPLL